MSIPIRQLTVRRMSVSFFLIALLASFSTAPSEDAAALKSQGRTLVDAQKFTEALPIYEKLSKLLPSDAEVFRNLGFSLIGQSLNTEDQASRKKMRARAREAFVKAKQFGDDSLLVKVLIDGIPPDGGDAEGYSDNAEANKLMQKAEAAFSTGKLDEAFQLYQSALEIDPRCYYAALFSGDVKTQTEKYDEAEKWYQRAIKIDPYIETAYQYSGTPLMKQRKYDVARDRYIEAFIVAPYNKLALSGIVQWGQTTNTPLGHPKVEVPATKTGADGKETTTINVNPTADDGSMAWIAYSATRETWKKEKFAKTYPREKEYRHSLAEEADALRSVVSMAKTLKVKSLHPQIAVIEKLDKDGLLEAFILMAIPDRGIAQDHPAYLRTNRDKLRKYVVDYVIGAKG
jgi:tetratricopeptide (TPR) repeat protein